MANQALYLKWRPYAFEDMIGQGHIVETLRNSLRQGRIRHAYLFSGPRGTGKTTSARLLAKAVNCVHPDVDQRPCNECSLCIAVNEGRFLDLIEIDAASHTGVDDVRDLRDKIAFAPSEGKYKVYIIDEVHRFSGAAFDALLKTLEEPPAHAIFVLATTEIDKVPATIKSRCLMFEFRRVSVREVVDRLRLIAEDEGISIDTTALELIARQGTGSVRDSISLLDQIVADPTQHITLEMAQYLLGAVSSRAVQEVVWAIIEGSTPAALDALNNAIDMGADPRQFGQQLVDYLRQIMLAQISGAEVVDASDEMRAVYAEQATQIDRRRLLKTLRSFNDAVLDLRGGWQPQLPLEIAIIESTQPLPAETVEAMPAQTSAPAPKPQPVKPVPPPSSADAHQVSEVFVRIQRDWPDFVKNSKRYGATLPALLEWCEPYQMEGQVLTLTLRHGGLLPKIQNSHNMEPLLKALEELAGQRLSVKITVIGESRSIGPENDDELDHYGVSHLGGEVEVLD